MGFCPRSHNNADNIDKGQRLEGMSTRSNTSEDRGKNVVTVSMVAEQVQELHSKVFPGNLTEDSGFVKSLGAVFDIFAKLAPALSFPIPGHRVRIK